MMESIRLRQAVVVNVELRDPERVQCGRIEIRPRIPVVAPESMVEAVQADRVLQLVRGIVVEAGAVVIAPARTNHVADEQAAIRNFIGAVTRGRSAVARLDALAAVEKDTSGVRHVAGAGELLALGIRAFIPIVGVGERRYM